MRPSRALELTPSPGRVPARQNDAMIDSVVPACRVRSEPRMSTRVPIGRLGQIAFVAACALLLGGPLMTAQQPSPQDQPRPTFRAEANYIRVDVYATTRAGIG